MLASYLSRHRKAPRSIIPLKVIALALTTAAISSCGSSSPIATVPVGTHSIVVNPRPIGQLDSELSVVNLDGLGGGLLTGHPRFDGLLNNAVALSPGRTHLGLTTEVGDRNSIHMIRLSDQATW